MKGWNFFQVTVSRDSDYFSSKMTISLWLSINESMSSEAKTASLSHISLYIKFQSDFLSSVFVLLVFASNLFAFCLSSLMLLTKKQEAESNAWLITTFCLLKHCKLFADNTSFARREMRMKETIESVSETKRILSLQMNFTWMLEMPSDKMGAEFFVLR